MRTLLTDSFPPPCDGERAFSSRAEASFEGVAQVERIFSQSAVLVSLDDFVEVGVDGQVIATPSALHAEQATAALERGVAFSPGKIAQTDVSSSSCASAVRNSNHQKKESRAYESS